MQQISSARITAFNTCEVTLVISKAQCDTFAEEFRDAENVSRKAEQQQEIRDAVHYGIKGTQVR